MNRYLKTVALLGGFLLLSACANKNPEVNSAGQTMATNNQIAFDGGCTAVFGDGVNVPGVGNTAADAYRAKKISRDTLLRIQSMMTPLAPICKDKTALTTASQTTIDAETAALQYVVNLVNGSAK